MKLTDRINAKLHELMRRRVDGFYRREIDLAQKMHPECFSEIPKAILDEHFNIWKPWDNKISDGWVLLLSTVTGTPDARFVPSTVYYGKLERILNNCNYSGYGVEQKNLMSFFVPIDSRAFCVLRYERGVFFDDEFRLIDERVASQMLSDYAGDLVGKIATDSSGGHSVELFRNKSGKKVGVSHELTIDWIKSHTNSYVVQECLRQHPSMAEFNHASINTCRIMTLRKPWNATVSVVSSMLRIGSSDSIVDNISSGGVSVGVKTGGNLTACGFDSTYGIVNCHPVSKMKFSGYVVPGYDSMCALAVKIASRIPDFNLLGFDIMLRDDGRPCIVEINTTSLCAIEVQQSGPMFGNDTQTLLDWCNEYKYLDTFKHLRTWY